MDALEQLLRLIRGRFLDDPGTVAGALEQHLQATADYRVSPENRDCGWCVDPASLQAGLAFYVIVEEKWLLLYMPHGHILPVV